MPENERFTGLAPLYPLDHIDPNPYNCRQSEDPEHVKKIALSIAADGLMQVPMGRSVDGRIQLAFGHTRMAAFKFLTDTGNPGFGMLPVILRHLSNDEMFRHGISENLARKDLTPIEEATAMKRYQEEFHKNSAEIGALFNLSDSAVRNKIRLLQLPAEIQTALNESKVSEGAGRALLELFDLPAEIRKEAETHFWEPDKPSGLVRSALAGKLTADQLREKIGSIINRFSVDLAEAGWKFEDAFEGAQIVGLCKGCAFRVRSDGHNLCLKKECYYAKEKVMERRYLEKASLACGIPIFEGDSKTSVTTFQYSGRESTLSTARAAHCPNLRLAYEKPYSDNRSDHLQEIGFPNAQILCGKQEQWCSCYQAVKAGMASKIIEKASGAVPGGNGPILTLKNGELEPKTEITANDLKDISREIRQKKKENLEENKGIQEEAAKAIARGLLNITNPRIWLMIMDRLDYSSANKLEAESKGDFSDDPVNWCDEIRAAIGKAIVQQKLVSNYYYSEPDPDQMFIKANELLKKCGLPELEGVSAETEATP